MYFGLVAVAGDARAFFCFVITFLIWSRSVLVGASVSHLYESLLFCCVSDGRPLDVPYVVRCPTWPILVIAASRKRAKQYGEPILLMFRSS